MGVFGKKEPKKDQKKKMGRRDSKAVGQLQNAMENGGTMSGRKAARAVRAMKNHGIG
ncbi:hypothetical protein ACQHIV_05935 [Kribbella sp. GL6]|uniref:hypothetical protein n=1 Tax=Kribbella sp. GL6 TaxID=3419765 RepID=UPI003CFC0F21